MSKPKTHPSTLFRRLLEQPGLIRGINIYDPLTARLALHVGFQAIALGEYARNRIEKKHPISVTPLLKLS